MATPWTQVPTAKTDWNIDNIDLGIGDWSQIPEEYTSFDPDNFDPGNAMFQQIAPMDDGGQDWSINPQGNYHYQGTYLHDMSGDNLISQIIASGLDMDDYTPEGEMVDIDAYQGAADWLRTGTLASINQYAQGDFGIDPQMAIKEAAYEGLESLLWSTFSNWEQGTADTLNTKLDTMESDYNAEIANITETADTKIKDLKESKYDTTDIAKAKQASFEAGKTGLVGGRAYKKIGREQDFQALSPEAIENEIAFTEEQKIIDMEAAEDIYEYDVWRETSQAYGDRTQKLIGLETDLLEYKVAFENEAQNVYNTWYGGLGSILDEIGSVEVPGQGEDNLVGSWDPWLNNMGGNM
jgi:hypothetical protein